MKVSVITVCYNSAKTIQDTIDSVANQIGVDIEHIIIDGGSKDGTIEIINKNGSKVAVFVSEKDKGIYDAMNKGVSLASGDIIGVLNSDDFFTETNSLSRIVELFKKESSLNVVYGKVKYVSFDNIQKTIREVGSKQYYDNFFLDGEIAPHPTFYVKNNIYALFGGYDLKYSLAADYDFIYRVLSSSIINSRYLNKVIVTMRLGGASNGNILNLIKINREILKTIRFQSRRQKLQFIIKRLVKKVSQFKRKRSPL